MPLGHLCGGHVLVVQDHQEEVVKEALTDTLLDFADLGRYRTDVGGDLVDRLGLFHRVTTDDILSPRQD